MKLLQPTLPPFDPVAWEKLPFPERARQVCESWVLQGYGSPLGVYALYGLKLLGYIGAWVFFCSRSPELGGLSTLPEWWLHPVAFQKAILWSMLFEGLGLGCGSGPLTGRYAPPVGGVLYFLRPGTTKLPRWPSLPLLGGDRRTVLDVALYLGLVLTLLGALLSAAPPTGLLIAVAVLVPLLGVADRTLFLALRSEHYWTTILCLLMATSPLAAAKAVQIALWFWAGVSKLNHHFPPVVAVMSSNSPWMRLQSVRRRMVRAFPEDLRPSRLAVWLAHGGTALELAVPLVLAFAPAGPWLIVGLVLMLMLHGYITSNVPMGVPIEWNAMVVYGGFALFWAHPELRLSALFTDPFSLFLLLMLVGLPLLGNLLPRGVSFLLAMRYYAGNWAGSVWLFRGDSYRKLDRLTKSAPWVEDQLALLYDERTRKGLMSKVMGFRLMHLHGRLVAALLPRAVPRLADYTYLDGEIVAGLVLGWNFGEGHLHQEALLAAVQRQCGFEEGELRCVFFESQPLLHDRMEWRVVDAARGVLERGHTPVSALLERQPWQGEPGAPSC